MGQARTRVGDQLGPYRLESVMAETAMAVVYRAVDDRTGIPVCIKTLHPLRSREDPLIRRFQREAKVATLLKNPNTVRVLDYGVADDGTLFLVMELLVGKTLRNVLRVHGPLGVPAVADIGVQICRSLEEAHRRGIVHRDLKPENVFICDDADGHPLVRVLDYGCARLAHGVDAGPTTSSGSSAEMESLTVVGMLIGTPAYMSPEQCMGVEISPRSDLYSLGVMLFELLSGHPPFEDESPLRLLSRQMTEPAPPLRGPGPLPQPLVEMVAKLLEKEPPRRPARAMDVLEVLLDLLEAPERRSQVGLEQVAGDETLVTPSPFGRFADEATLRDLEPPAREPIEDEELEDDRTMPWNRPFRLQSVTFKSVGSDPPSEAPTVPGRPRK